MFYNLSNTSFLCDKKTFRKNFSDTNISINLTVCTWPGNLLQFLQLIRITEYFASQNGSIDSTVGL